LASVGVCLTFVAAHLLSVEVSLASVVLCLALVGIRLGFVDVSLATGGVSLSSAQISLAPVELRLGVVDIRLAVVGRSLTYVICRQIERAAQLGPFQRGKTRADCLSGFSSRQSHMQR